MQHCLAALVLLWQGCSAFRGFVGSGDLADERGENSNGVVNIDRVQCLRQDNLDLVGADTRGRSVQYIMRQAIVPDVSAIGFNAQNTKNDIYIFVKDLLIRNFQANLELKRVGETDFEFKLTGNKAYKGTTGVGNANIWLSGFDLETKSKVISWATALAANKEVLREGQEGTLHFSLSGLVRSKIGKKGLLEVDLFDTAVKLFQFEFTSQQILQTSLNKFGGLERFLLDGILDIVKLSISPSLLASMRYIPLQSGIKNEDQDLWLSASLALTGSMLQPNAELNLDTSLSVIAHVRPAKLIQVFTEQFNITELAEARVEAFLSNPAVQRAWKNNRPAFVRNLKQYRLLAGDLLDVVENTTELPMLRPRLLKAAAEVGDTVTQALQPFVKAYAQGKLGYAEEFKIMLEGNIGWDDEVKDGMLWANLRPSKMVHGAAWLREFHATSAQEEIQLGSTDQAVNFAWVPLELLDVLGLGDLLTAPDRGKVTGLKIEKASLDLSELNSDLNISNVALSNFLRWMSPSGEGEGDAELMEITNAELADVSLRLPSVLKPDFADISLTSLGINGELTSSGVLTLSSSTGFELNLNESEADDADAALRRRREGSPDAIDGPMEHWVSRPSEDGPGLSRKVATRMGAGGIYLKVSGSANGLSLDFQAKTQVTANLGKVLGSVLAGRPTEDFGYAFFAEHLVWERTASHTTPTRNSVAAVLNCGYLRLLEFPLRKEPLSRLDTSDGQLELDIAKYKDAPVIVDRYAGPDETNLECCMDLYTSGHKAPTVGGWWSRGGSHEVKDAVCGSCEKVRDLGAAIALQVRRFQDHRAAAWGFGTHNESSEKQFNLPAGRTTMDLVEILSADPETLRFADTQDVPRSMSTASTQADASRKPMPAEKLHKDISTEGKVTQIAVAELPRGDYVGDEISKPSFDALKCRAEEDLDGLVFPPEKKWYGDAAIRMVIPESPLGEIHVALQTIQIMDVDLDFRFKRVSDNSFLFELGTKEKHAKLNLWIEGLKLDLPGGILDDLLKFGSGFESLVGSIFGAKDVGRLDRGPLNLDLYIKGEFHLNDKGRWKIQSSEAVSDVDIQFGAGGLLQAIINYLVAHFGNMDKVFADIVWPILTSLIPGKVGYAFTKVREEYGQIDTKFKITAQCKAPVDGRCPDDEVTLNLTATNMVIVKPEPIVKDLIRTEYLTTDSPASLFEQAWDEGKLPLRSSIVELRLEAKHRLGDFLNIQGAGNSQLNMALLETVLGKDSLLIDIIPGSGDFLAKGQASAQFDRGMIDLPKLRVEKARLPFAIGNGDVAQALELDVTLQKFQARLFNESKQDIQNMSIFLDVHADRERGFYVTSDGKKRPTNI